MSNFINTFVFATGPGWQPLLHAAYVLSGVLMAAGYVAQIRRAWRTPQASLLAQSTPSWLLWTLCRAVALAYVICIVGDAALILAVGLDVAGRAGVLLVLLRARLLMSVAKRASRHTATAPQAQRLPSGLANTVRRRLLRRTVFCALLLPALAVPAATTAMAVGSAAQTAAYADARELLQHKRYAEAYGRLAALADQGHVASAQLALALYDHGPALLGQAWSATPGQQRRWFVLVQPMKRARNFLPDTEARE